MLIPDLRGQLLQGYRSEDRRYSDTSWNQYRDPEQPMLVPAAAGQSPLRGHLPVPAARLEGQHNHPAAQVREDLCHRS